MKKVGGTQATSFKCRDTCTRGSHICHPQLDMRYEFQAQKPGTSVGNYERRRPKVPIMNGPSMAAAQSAVASKP